ncbi:transcription factor bHLH162-like [Solanum dulcamara]|uniref:transcription factor bHLH162-like n=1 Tax=Solanum dulcamara TaxID=45834 RepID=UPI002485BD25|nr:transcription factor bHLH162-like [Solanum dulcamara]
MEQQYCCNKTSSSSSCKAADRKTIEKNRRNQMKDLYMKLNSLVHRDQHSKEFSSLPDQLEEAANYIKKMQIDLEKMRLRKESLTAADRTLNSNSNSSSNNNGRILERALPLPHIEIHSVNSALEILLITGLDNQFMFNHIIRMLHEEGVQVINASYTLVGDTIFHSIHSKEGESTTSSGNGAALRIISEKLKQFVGAAAT